MIRGLSTTTSNAAIRPLITAGPIPRARKSPNAPESSAGRLPPSWATSVPAKHAATHHTAPHRCMRIRHPRTRKEAQGYTLCPNLEPSRNLLYFPGILKSVSSIAGLISTLSMVICTTWVPLSICLIVWGSMTPSTV